MTSISKFSKGIVLFPTKYCVKYWWNNYFPQLFSGYFKNDNKYFDI